MEKEILSIIKGSYIHRKNISNLPANAQLRTELKSFEKQEITPK